ncbi:MAG TPA: PTS sugar transporter subunit IIC [Desulfomonilaceae bacterium]|nr:PTS sugar transporter subunit IIC [Desulfomonilaceae bacterium]
MAGAVGALLWLDRFQIFQIMISRPIVCAPIIGWVMGDLEAGLASGLLFEMLWLRRPPVGGYIPPDATLGSISTAAVSALVRTANGGPLTSTVFLCFLFLFPVAFLGKHIDVQLRIRLGNIARKAEAALEAGGERNVYRYFASALLLGFTVAFVILFPAILWGSLLLTELAPRLPPSVVRGLGFGFYAVPLLGTADLMAGLNERRYVILFVIGLVISLGGGLILGF